MSSEGSQSPQVKFGVSVGGGGGGGLGGGGGWVEGETAMKVILQGGGGGVGAILRGGKMGKTNWMVILGSGFERLSSGKDRRFRKKNHRDTSAGGAPSAGATPSIAHKNFIKISSPRDCRGCEIRIQDLMNGASGGGGRSPLNRAVAVV